MEHSQARHNPASNFRERPRPNYFFSTRILSKEVIAKSTEIQNHLKKQLGTTDERVFSPHLHITLVLMSIQEPKILQQVIDFIQNPIFLQQAQSLFPSLESAQVNVKDLGNFGSTILWMGLEDGPAKTKFVNFVDFLHESFSNAVPELLLIRDHDEYSPHISICRGNKNMRRMQGHMYNKWKNQQFGIHLLDNIELSSMMERDADGYYKSHGSFSIHKNNSESEKKILDPEKPDNITKQEVDII